MKMRHARRAIFPVLCAVVLIAASAYQAAARTTASALVHARTAAMTVVTGPSAAYQLAAPHKALSRAVALYAVRGGDTLSSIAAARCGTAIDWTGIFAASRAAHRTGADPNLIYPGQLLVLSCRQATIPDPPAAVTSAHVTYGAHSSSSGHVDNGGKTWGVTYGYPNYCGDGDGDGWDRPCGTPARTSSGYSGRSESSGSGGGYGNVSASGYSGFQACVIARESGGNSQVMNSSGHYGLYQFSSGTWQAYGGSAADFGHASVAEQNRVFANAMAAGGQGNWAPYDGC